MGHLKAVRNVTLAALLLASGLGAAGPSRAAGGQEQPAPAEPEATPGTQAQWLGMARQDLFSKIGKPSQVIEYPDTGGQLLIYSHLGQKHYVFETGPNGKVIRASETK